MAIGSRPKVTDVALQDQSSPIVDVFLTRKLGTCTLAAPVAFDARTLTLVAGHGFTADLLNGNMIEISEGGRWFQSRVKTVSTNTLTVNNPFCCAFTTAATVKRVTHDMNINASASPVLYTALPPTGVQWDINIMSFNMLDDTAMDDSKFGGIPALSNGVVYRTVDGETQIIFNSLDNGCFLRHCDTEDPYSAKAPAGLYGFNAKRRMNGQNGDGVARRLGGSEVNEFQAVVYDDLSGLTRFWTVLRGHVVESPATGATTRVTLTDQWQAITSVGQSATVWLMGNPEAMVTSSATASPNVLTAYPLYRGNILALEPDDPTADVFYAKCMNVGCTTEIVVDVIG